MIRPYLPPYPYQSLRARHAACARGRACACAMPCSRARARACASVCARDCVRVPACACAYDVRTCVCVCARACVRVCVCGLGRHPCRRACARACVCLCLCLRLYVCMGLCLCATFCVCVGVGVCVYVSVRGSESGATGLLSGRSSDRDAARRVQVARTPGPTRRHPSHDYSDCGRWIPSFKFKFNRDGHGCQWPGNLAARA